MVTVNMSNYKYIYTFVKFFTYISPYLICKHVAV